MELMHQMTPHLKQLRLSGILETLEARKRQAIAVDSALAATDLAARHVARDDGDNRVLTPQICLGAFLNRAGDFLHALVACRLAQ